METRHEIASVNDIYAHADHFRTTAERYAGAAPSQPSSDATAATPPA